MTANPPWSLQEHPPTLETYQRLREIMGWGRLDPTAAARGLVGALYSVTVVHGQDEIACARIVGDNGIYFYVQDMMVHPDWQGRGIAPRLYEYVFERLRERGMRYVKVHTGGDPAHAPARRAYQKAGFEIALPQVDYYREL